MRITNENHFQIQGWMRTQLNLKGNELLVYAIIYGFSQDRESQFYGGRNYLADFVGASTSTIDRTLESLCDKEFIIKNSQTVNGVLFNSYIANSKWVGGSQNDDTPLVKMTTNNKDNIDNKKKDILHISKERFSKPTLEEVNEHIKNNDYHFSAEDFINHYESVGWKVGKSPMKDWKACCRTWESNWKKKNQSVAKPGTIIFKSRKI